MSDRTFSRFLGIDLGGGRGKTTVVAEVRTHEAGGPAAVFQVATRAGGGPWTDDALIAHVHERRSEIGDQLAIAIDAPLTQPACARCVLPACPGMEVCVDPAVVWLRSEGRALMAGEARMQQQHQGGGAVARRSQPIVQQPQARLAPYAHRATDLVMTYGRGLLPVTALGAPHGAVAARAHHLRRRLAALGFTLNANLVEVSPAATIAALCGPRAARGYKRDADPWRTRASILEQLAGDLVFAPQSRMAREDVLQNDHGFDAVIAAYTAARWARDGLRVPEGIVEADGWIFAPESVR